MLSRQCLLSLYPLLFVFLLLVQYTIAQATPTSAPAPTATSPLLTSLLTTDMTPTTSPTLESTASAPSSPPGTAPASSSSSTNNGLGGSKTNLLPPVSTGGPPDVHLYVPELSVKRIELDVDNLSAEINLNANVANLVSINAGISASIRKVNLTISDVGAELELNVRLGHLVEVVNRVFQSLDLNPLLIATINNVTSVLETTIGAVDGLLGSIAQGGSTLNFLVDNLGNIVQQVTDAVGKTTNTIVGDWQSNMTYTGKQQTLQNGLVQKQYKYSPLNALVNIVFNGLNQIVSATVVKQDSSASGKLGGSGPAVASATEGSAQDSPPLTLSSPVPVRK